MTTPAGVAAAEELKRRAVWEAHSKHAQSAVQVARLESTATQSLAFGLVGVLLCCTPVGVAGIVQGGRARAMAKTAGVAVPTKATIGLVLSILSLFTSIAAFVLIDRDVQADKRKAAAHAAAIDARLGSRPAEPTLDGDVACGLAEAYLYREGAAGIEHYLVQEVQCMGRVTLRGEGHAELDTVRFKSSTDKREVRVCFARGGKWYVASATTESACPE